MKSFVEIIALAFLIASFIVAIAASIFVDSDDYPKSSPSDDASTNVGIGGII